MIVLVTPGDSTLSWQQSPSRHHLPWQSSSSTPLPWQSSSSTPVQPLPVPQVEVTVASSPTEPGTNLGFEADFTSCQKLRILGVSSLVSQPIVRGEVVVPTQPTTVEFDQTLGKWCLKNLTGSKSFDQQLEQHSVIDVAGCLRRNRVRRDSVGASNSSNSSPNSSLTSPRRWAAKAEELHENEAEPSIFPVISQNTGNRNICPRSCSADHLGAIVDILGVPTGAPQFWENPRRLILSAEKRKIEMKR